MNAIDGFSTTELGKRLRSARESSGITQADAAAALKAARTTIVAIEKGERRIQLREMQTLCRLYSTSVNELCRTEAAHLDLNVQFRRLPECKPGPMADAATLLSDLVRAEVELESLLGIRRPRLNPPEKPILVGNVVAQAEQDALDFRHWIGLAKGPIKDVFGIIQFSLGGRAFARKLDSRISAAFAYDPVAGPCFLLNSNHPKTRQNQSCAHELGHLISSRTAPQVLLIDATFKTREEKYADAFGRAFLMPAREVIQKFNEITAGMKKLTRRHVILLGHHFAVSREATVRRLEELELVKKGTWDWFSMHGGITNEQVTQVLGSLASETENADGYSVTELRLHQLAAEVYRQALMSEGQLARLLKIDRPELRSILDSQQLDEEGAACDILT